jgi:hypothetical protein
MERAANAHHYAEHLASFLSDANTESDYAARVDGLMLLLYSMAMAHTSQDSTAARQLLHRVIDGLGDKISEPANDTIGPLQ